MEDALTNELEETRDAGVVPRALKPALSHAREIACFFGKAFVLVALLAVAARYAPLLPSYAIPLVLLVYALPATVGSMYGIVVKRFHDQLKYNEEGMASKYNRRWTGWMAAFFALSLVSATMFLLDAPAWDSTQWFFIGFAAVI